MNEMDEFKKLFDYQTMNKDALNRATTYDTYLELTEEPWYDPKPEAFLKYLKDILHLTASSAAAHMGAYRSRYRFLLKDENAQQLLKRISERHDTPEQFLLKAQSAMERATETSVARVGFRRTPNISHVHPRKIDTLFQQFDVRKPIGIRDAFGIGLIYGGGLNEIDLCNLQLQDIKPIGNELFVSVAPQNNDPARTVPVYDDTLFSQPWIEAYLATYVQIMNASSGFLMRGFIKGGIKLDANSVQMTVRALRKMIHSYTEDIAEEGETSITALDLRRTYARRLFERHMSAEEIGANLGHVLLTTTLEYIGQPSLYNSEDAFIPDGTRMIEVLRHQWPKEFRYKWNIED